MKIKNFLIKNNHNELKKLEHDFFKKIKNKVINSFQNSEVQSNFEIIKKDHPFLIWAVVFKDIDTVRKFIEYGGNINIQDKYGSTALMYAAESGNFDITLLLIENRADITIIDNEGFNALDYANEHAHIITFLKSCEEQDNEEKIRLENNMRNLQTENEGISEKGNSVNNNWTEMDLISREALNKKLR